MRKTILTIAAIIIATVSAFSQSVTETRQIKTTALQVYENYKVVMSGLYSRNAYTEDNFKTLFEDKALIYNDIVPDNNPQQLSPSDYFEKFHASIKRIYPAFSDFKMGEPVSVGNKWQIKCNFTRGTRFSTQKDMRYPEWSFNYTMTIEMDKWYNRTNKVYENAEIVSVDVENPLKGFFVIENKENMPLVTKSGEMLKDWDKEYQSRIFPEDKWKIQDIRVSESINNNNIFEFSKSKFSKNKTDAHFYQPDVQRFKKNIFGIGVNYSPNALNLGYQFKNEKLKDYFKHTSEAISLSLFYGKQIAHKKKSTLFANIGLDFNIYSHTFNNTDIIHQEVNNSIDTDEESYNRRIKISVLNETINMTSVSIPLSVQYLHQLTERAKNPIFFSCELGGFAEVPLSSKSNYNLNADYSGVYEKYFNVEFEHYFDYGNFEVKDGKGELKPRFNSGIFGGLGLWFTLNESNLLKFSVSYKHSFNSPLKDRGDYVIAKSNSKTKELYPDNYEPYQSLLYTKQGMRNISIGISWVKTIGGK